MITDLHGDLPEDALLSFEQVAKGLWTAKIQELIPMRVDPPNRAHYIHALGKGATLELALEDAKAARNKRSAR